MEFLHVAMMLSRTFKAEIGIKFFYQPLALKTEGGQGICVWFARFIKILKDKGSSMGPFFVGHKGKCILRAKMDILFHALLLDV